MLITLLICLYFGINVHADAIINSAIANNVSTTSSEFFNEDSELAKISVSCLSTSNYEELSGSVVRRHVARILGVNLIPATLKTIGLTELRETLNLAPLPPWKKENDTEPSESELASAPTIQAYYDLKEPKSFMRSLDSWFLYEHNLIPAIAYFDKRFPSIRVIFKRRFEKIRPELLDRKGIDRMIDEFRNVNKKIDNAVEEMRNNDECFFD